MKDVRSRMANPWMRLQPFWYCEFGKRLDVVKALSDLRVELSEVFGDWDFVSWLHTPKTASRNDISFVSSAQAMSFFLNMVGLTATILFGLGQQRHGYRICCYRRLYYQFSWLYERLILLHGECHGIKLRQQFRSKDCYLVFDVEDHNTMVADIATQKPPSVAGPAI